MPPQVQDQDVPIFTERKFPILPTEWDITMQQVRYFSSFIYLFTY